MFFVIAGIQPRTRTLEGTPQRCPRCGLYQARTQQVDHYLSLFFIPLIPVKRGEPFLFCQRCDQPVAKDGEQSARAGDFSRQQRACGRCGRTLQSDFEYCPFCGWRQ